MMACFPLDRMARWKGGGLSSTLSWLLLASFLPQTQAFSAGAPAPRIVWHTTDLRLHDHEALQQSGGGTPLAPIYIFDKQYLASQSPHTIALTLSAVRNLRSSYLKRGGDLIVREGRAEEVLPQLAEELQADTIWCYDDVASSQRELVSRGLQSLTTQRDSSRPAAQVRTWASRLRPGIKSTAVGDTYPSYLSAIKGVRIAEPLPSPTSLALSACKEVGRLPSFEELLEAAHGGQDEHDEALRATRVAAARDEFLTPVYGAVEAGEDLALAWLKEYLEVGPDAFGQKHLPLTGDNGLEREAVRRVISAEGFQALFEGEVFSRCFSPLLGVGCLSPRQVAKALREKKEASSSMVLPFFGQPPETAKLDEVLEQKEWHTYLAEQDLSPRPPASNDEEETIHFGYWKWHGYLVRYASSTPIQGGGEASRSKPNLLLVHGFGASADQWAKCFRELSHDNHVWAIDLLGFGHSEKTPVTYTQYLWQDQVRDFALEIIQAPYFIAGNSIGGYISMSVAADNNRLCQGLILINTAGKIVTTEVYEEELAGRSGITIEEATRTGALGPFSGPPKFLLRLVSQGLFWYLQPRVEEICRNLYKKRPEEVGPRLVQNIVRDSMDPGALGVFASGGRLPPPRPANELLRKFGGPVLVAQGALDPLNDAQGRAELLRTCYAGTTVALIEAGHCPHDEDPVEVSKAIDRFVRSILSPADGTRVDEAAAGAALPSRPTYVKT